MTNTLLWVPLAILAMLSMAAMALISEFQQVPTIPRLFWLRAFTCGALSPLIFIIDWPSDPIFYMCTVGLTFFICISDILYYGSARDNGAGPTTRTEPLSVLLTFVAWSVVVPAQLGNYAQKPLLALGICACFALAGFCAMHLRKCDVSRSTLKKLIPVIVIMAAVNILGKTGMDHGGHPFDAAFAYILIQASMLSVFYGTLCLSAPGKNGSIVPTRPLLVSGALMAVASILHVVPKNAAYTFVSNPAYVNVIGLSAPFCVSLFYRLRGRPDAASVWAGFGIVASAAALIVLTRF